MTALTRRGALAAAASLALPGCATPAAPADAPLTELAAAKGIRFGTAIAARQLDDQRLLDLIRRECGVIVAENEHKMYTIEPTQGARNFAPADALVRFAKENGLGMRGHTLVWHHPRWLPKWVGERRFANASEAEGVLGGYIQAVASRYAPFLYSWDVVNEAVDDKTGVLRETSFSRAMGPEVIDFCFHAARAAAPSAKLAYNDFMSWERNNEAHRAGVLRLLEGLRRRGAPIDALGIQSHSNYDMPDEFTPEKQRAWRAFCDEVAGMGLEIYLTEFDIADTRLPSDIAVRDQLIAAYAKDYLDLMFSYRETKDLLFWGAIDRDSWLQGVLPRSDGLEQRPTLFASDYSRKPIYDAVAAALRAAPARS